MALAGLILAGGRSRRFGSEKAVAEIDGASLLERVLVALAPHCAPIAIAAPIGSGAAVFARQANLALVADAEGVARGPLAGVLGGLDWALAAGATWLATVPCDTPFLPGDLIPRLAAAARGEQAAVARSPSGRQPLCAVWPIEATRRALRSALSGATHPSVRRILDELAAVEVAFGDDNAFANINAQGDLAAARQAERPQPSPWRSRSRPQPGKRRLHVGGVGARGAGDLAPAGRRSGARTWASSRTGRACLR